MSTTDLLNKIAKGLESTNKRLQQLENQPSSKAWKADDMMSVSFDQNWHKNPWPKERIERLSKAYNHDWVTKFMAHDGYGKPRGIGWGPALVEMAGLADPSLNIRSSHKALEEGHGFVTVMKANKEGIKGPNGEVRKVALAEGAGNTGGYVIPPQFISDLLTIQAEENFFEPKCTQIPMQSRTAQWPFLDVTTNQGTGVSPYFGGVVGYWQPEAATINESEPAFREGTWTAWDLVVYTVASNQILQDNGIGLDALLTQLFSKGIAWYKEYAFLRGLGAGSSMPLGIANAPATYSQARSTASNIKLADIAAMMSRLHMQSWDKAIWIAHPSVIPQLIQMTNGASNAPFLVWMNMVPGAGIEGPAAQKPPATLLGLPIFFTEKVPTLGTANDLMLVDPTYYVIGNRLDMQIDVSKDFLFRTNQLAWRVVARCDGKPWLNSTITDANGWVSSPFVGLAA